MVGTIGSNSDVNASSSSMVAWTWKANGAGSSNTDGSTASTVSANTAAGFSIVQFTGTNGNTTVGHGLGGVPEMFMIKKLKVQVIGWFIIKIGVQSLSGNLLMLLNLTNAQASDTGRFTKDGT